MSSSVRSVLAVWGGLMILTAVAQAQTPAGPAFSYQGRLTDGGAAANGLYDLRFTLYDASTGAGLVAGPVAIEDVPVVNGLFTVSLDFGAAAFAGHARWLAIEVRPGASTGSFTPLDTRQAIEPAPHAIFSQRAANATTAAQAVNANQATSANTALSADSVPWTGVSGKPASFADDVDDDLLGGLSCAANQVPKSTGAAWICAADNDGTAAWSVGGNTAASGSFLGTLNAQPLELRTNGERALWLVPHAGGPNIVGGHAINSVGAGIAAATIAGGFDNHVTGSGGAIGGGTNNSAGAYAVVGGGRLNNASGIDSTVAGGRRNAATESWSTVAGGYENSATGQLATVLGGGYNEASGAVSFAAGFRAVASHDFSFVWNGGALGGTGVAESTAPGQFIALAPGGFWFGKAPTPSISPVHTINTSTGAYLTDAGDWTNSSDRNLKEHFEPIDGRQLLDRLAMLPVTRWNYKKAPGVFHVGPTAQDFKGVFGLGGDDKAISTLDPAGIALRAIQQLDLENQQLRAEIERLKSIAADVAQLKAQLDALTGAQSARQQPVNRAEGRE